MVHQDIAYKCKNDYCITNRERSDRVNHSEQKIYFDWKALKIKYPGPAMNLMSYALKESKANRSSCHIVICLDSSPSMKGERWDEACKGTLTLMNDVRRQVSKFSKADRELLRKKLEPFQKWDKNTVKKEHFLQCL